MTKRVVLANLQQFLALVNKYPRLGGLSSFAALIPIINDYKNTTGCKCNIKARLATYKVTFDNCIQNVSPADRNVLKQLLQADEICYYIRSTTGGLSLQCF